MTQWHINKKGEPGKCSAQPGKCPYGATEDHYSTAREATEAIAAQHSPNALNSLRKPPIENLIQELTAASKAYYQEFETSPLTDEEFDDKLAYLKKLSEEPENKHLFTEGTQGFLVLEGDPGLGTTTTSDNKVIHETPMLSLGKAKTETELQAWATKMEKNGAKGFKLQAKFDGFALSAEYNNGKFGTLSTRGDGKTGEDVSYILNSPQITIVGLPNTTDQTNSFELRGELFLTQEQFEKADAERYKLTGQKFENPRNAAVGIIKKAKQGLDYPVEFTYATYTYLDGKKQKDTDQLTDKQFVTVDAITLNEKPDFKLSGYKNTAEMLKAVEEFGQLRKNFKIPTDGVVIKATNEAEMNENMGANNHHPYSQIAYKYPGETAETVIEEITVTVGKTGKLTPIARIKPVKIDGSTITNVTLNNYNWAESKDVRVGSKVVVTKANDIIPEVQTVLENPTDSKKLGVPKTCPNCKSTLAAIGNEYPPKTLRCSNEECSSRQIFALKGAVGARYLKIDGLAESTINTLYDQGRIKTLPDLYTLNEKELAESSIGTNKEGTEIKLGKDRAQKIITNIETSKKAPTEMFLASLGVESLGRTTSKMLMKEYDNIDSLLEATPEDIAKIDGFGIATATDIATGLKKKEPTIRALQAHGVPFSFNKPKITTGRKVTGKTYSISGSVPEPFKNRDEMINWIESNGGIFHKAPKAGTDYVIGDPTSGSAKITKARGLGATIIDPTEFTKDHYEE